MGSPDVMSGVIPCLTVRGAREAASFCERVFGARERLRAASPEGALIHVELVLDGGCIGLTEESLPERPSPLALGGYTTKTHVYVSDVRATLARALERGAVVLEPVHVAPWREEYAKFQDPFGHVWSIGSRSQASVDEVVNR